MLEIRPALLLALLSSLAVCLIDCLLRGSNPDCLVEARDDR